MAYQLSQTAPREMNYGYEHGNIQAPDIAGGDINELATLQKGSGGGLPSWLNPNPNALTRELKQTYKGLPGIFDTAGMEGAYDDEIATVGGMGGQIATNAAREAIARSGQTGGQVNSEMAKAQSMLPVFQQTGALAKDKANAMLDAAKAQASIQAQVAGTLGQLRTSYLANLAQVHMQKKQIQSGQRTNAAELALRKYQGDQSNQLSIENMAQQQGQFEDQQALAEKELGMNLAQKRSGSYITESGPGSVGGGTPTTGYGKFLSGDKGLYDINTHINSDIYGMMR